MAAPLACAPQWALIPPAYRRKSRCVVDGTGKLVATDTIYPHTGQAKAATVIAALCEKYHVELSRLATTVRPRVKPNALLSRRGCETVPERDGAESDRQRSGASVYSASELAARRSRSGCLPCAARVVSIARRSVIRWRNW